MREGKLYINNLDAYATYGVFLANDRGGTYDNLSALMTPPPVKNTPPSITGNGMARRWT